MVDTIDGNTETDKAQVKSAKLNGHDPFAYLKDVLSRLPTQPYSRISELLPHRWQNLAPV